MKLLFSKYMSIGVFNTALHWVCFYTLYNLNFSQSESNFLAFLVAVTFSFFANAKFTFKAKTTTSKYLLYTTFLGGLAALVGKISDISQLHPILTLVFFSGSSLIIGFLYSNYIVFKENK